MRVQVLMSTYNGERYLREQLDSIYAQGGVDISLLVRDDGSSDDTTNILSDEQAKGRLRWYSGNRLGPAYSFLHLLRHCDDEADLYAFSDQDDVWDADKLSVAAHAIGKETKPALYFCQTHLVDEQLNDLPQVPISPKLTYGEAMAYQFVGGCTMVFNKALREVVNQYEPDYLRMHDVWVYCIALAVGARVVFDPIPHMRYRQHSGNAVGQTTSLRRQWKERIERLRKHEGIRSSTAGELMKGYAGMMTPKARALTGDIVGYKSSLPKKLSLLFSPQLTPSRKLIALTSRLAILFNLF